MSLKVEPKAGFQQKARQQIPDIGEMTLMTTKESLDTSQS